MVEDPDRQTRMAAFAALDQLVIRHRGRVPWRAIAEGFDDGGRHVHFASRALGIFKPKQMTAALSVRTTMPRRGRERWYQDQESNRDNTGGLLPYDLARATAGRTNDHLRAAFERNAPLIYFRGAAEAVYEALWPVWIADFDESKGRALLAALEPASAGPPFDSASVVQPESRAREYVVVETTRRNHQAWFSSQTKSAYGYRCALSGLPLRELLVGAHIIPDAEDGPATVPNGICMSTLHHTAFDAHLLGIDPDLRIHVARSVSEGRDGPLLESLKHLHSGTLSVPQESHLQPDRTFLERRFAQFEAAQL